MNWSAFSDTLLINALEARGYVVRHSREARKPLSWNRTAPFPKGVDFKAEAVLKLREQITPELVDFRVTPAQEDFPEIHRALLRVL